MSSEWPIVSLGDCIELDTGFPFKSAEYTDSEDAIRLLRGDNIGQGQLRWDGVKRWARKEGDALEAYELRKKDLVLAMDRPWIAAGLKFAKVRDNDLPALLVQRVARLRPKPCIDVDFLHSVVSSPDFTQHIQNVTTGTAVPHISGKQIQEYKFALPDIFTQESVGKLLMSLVDRITLLHETNASLESIAQALFKSWFVDFEPVRAKMEGCAPEGMDEATAALFSDSFEESELGVIPKGWKHGSVYEIATITYGAPFASKLFKSEQPGKPLVRIRDLKDERPGVYTEEVHPKGYLLQPGDIAVGMDGEFRAYLWGGEEAWLNQRVCVFKPINCASAAYVKLSITPLLAAVEASETATTVIHLGKNDIDRFKVVLPSPKVLEAFSIISKPLYDRLIYNKQQAQTLGSLRDILLPRLISGLLRLPDVNTVA